MTAEVDFAAEGLLDGLEGAPREGRLKLLRELHSDGVGLDDLRTAVAEDRLVLLPVERLLGGEARYTARELADRSGVKLEALAPALAAFGQPGADPDERRWGESDLAAARRVRVSLDHGLSAENVVDLNRVIGRATTQIAA
ncbi:MAG: adenylate cyclase regulatory domain-containing protein, partial [Solirubrobacteraceae bacterium]